MTSEDAHTHIPSLNVYQRLNLCKRKVGEASFKKVKGEGLKFSYLPIETIKPVVEDAMNEAGLVLEFGKLRTHTYREPYERVGKDYTKTMWFHLDGELEFTWINIDDPKDRITMTFSGEAKDNSDKTISKLYTAIIKNFYKAVFNISTDRKEDTDNTEDEYRDEMAEAEARKKVPAPPEGYEYNMMGKLVKKKTPAATLVPAGLTEEIDESWPTVLQKPLKVKLDTIMNQLRSASMWEHLLPIFKQFQHSEEDRMAYLRKTAQFDSIEFVNALYSKICEVGKEVTE